MSDLQCPCLFLLLRPVGPDRAREVAVSLAGRLVAQVYAAPGEDASATARAASDALGTGFGVLGELAAADGSPNTYRALEELSDRYRGETVLVVCDLDSLGPAYAEVNMAEVAVDADGWQRVDAHS